MAFISIKVYNNQRRISPAISQSIAEITERVETKGEKNDL